ncbi:MAG: universal stress protein [Sphaerobacteraceae bacterium]|nr:MAG: universal stress protein [Sphaerobacteraceae bacterium]
MVSSIIVPLDQSHVAECAVPYARALARRTGAPLTLVSVVEPSESLPDPRDSEDLPPIEEPPVTSAGRQYSASLPIGMNPGDPGMTEEDLEEATSALREAEHYLTYVSDSIRDVHVEKMVVHGSPISEILRMAEHRGSDPGDQPVIVMASHGRSGLGRVLLGSVALKVAEQSPCPMFVVRAIQTRPPSLDEIDMGHVLVALDGSDFSEEVLEPVRRLFGHDKTRLHLVRVVELDRNWVTGSADARDADGRSDRDVAEQYLSNMADRLRARGYSVEWDVVEGKPADRINSIAGDLDVGVVAMATHGHSGLKRFAIGSVAEDVLQKATRPLMLVRPHERD